MIALLGEVTPASVTDLFVLVVGIGLALWGTITGAIDKAKDEILAELRKGRKP